MKHIFRRVVLAAGLLPALANAHVVLDRPQARAGSYHRADLVVGHGCEGSPTRRVTVFLPQGFATARPQPKPGWTLEVERTPLAEPVLVHGRPVNDAVTRITWTGGPLPDAHFEQFGLLVQVPATPGRLFFRVLQECEQGAIDWAQLPGEDGGRPRRPVAVMEVVPAAGQGGHAGH